MSIKFYMPGEHPAGFVGFRVNIAYGNRYLQSYFSTSAAESQSDADPYFLYRRLEAEIQEKTWKLESLLYQYRRFVSQNHPNTKPERGVGVHGITAAFTMHGTHWQPGFIVSVKQDGAGSRRPAKRFTFLHQPYSQAWRDAVTCWAEEHDIAAEDAERVLSNQPDPEQFKRLRRQINEREGGHIPVAALSPVFAEQRNELARRRALRKAERMKLNVGAPAGSNCQDIQADMAAWFEEMTKQSKHFI